MNREEFIEHLRKERNLLFDRAAAERDRELSGDIWELMDNIDKVIEGFQWVEKANILPTL